MTTHLTVEVRPTLTDAETEAQAATERMSIPVVLLFAGFLIAVTGAVCLATGPAAYAGFVALMGSVFGKLVLFGLTTAAFYYMASGVRHLVWDTGRGFQPRVASTSALLAFVFGFVMAVLVWAVAFAVGAA